MPNERLINIPNLLSGYRLLSSPLLVYLAFAGQEHLFLVLLGISLLTDILDGAIARAFNLQTTFGARLDSMADGGTYVVVACGLYFFRRHQLMPVGPWIAVFVAVFAIPYIVSLIKFGKMPSLHLYSCKAGGALDTAFLSWLFVYGFSKWLFYAAISWGVVSFAEMTLVILYLPALQSNCRSIIRVIKQRGSFSFRAAMPPGQR